MKSYWYCFERMLWGLLFGIPLGCAVATLAFFAVFFVLDPNATKSVADSALRLLVMASVAGMVCLPIGLIFGAPVGALLFRKGRANYWTAATAGLCPALLALVVDADQESWMFTAMFPVVFGLPVALLTYWFAKRRIDQQV